jgi:hypothetical protein
MCVSRMEHAQECALNKTVMVTYTVHQQIFEVH